MPGKRGAGYEVIRKLVEQFPDAPARTLARKAFAETPECWKDLETCRLAVRVQLGVAGKHQRTNTADKSHYRPPRQAGWSDVIPEAIEQLNGWQPLDIPGPHRALILSDIHIPYHDADALEVALEWGIARKPTLILLNGDLVDHYALSRWETDPKQRDFPGEVAATKQFLAGLRRVFPKARIIIKHGNHEERFERYMRFQAPALLGVPAFEWSAIYDLEAQRIELVAQKRPIGLGDLSVIHGHEYVFQIANPVNPARGLFNRAKVHALCGHFHQSSNHTEKTMRQKVITTWSTGCLCDLHPEYRPLNNWGHGFAYAEIDKAGAFRVENLRIIDGKVY